MPILIPEISLEAGGEYDFATSDTSIIEAFSPGEWNGESGNLTIFNSDDGVTQANVTLPSRCIVSFMNVSNIAVTGPFKLYCDKTCVNGGNNNANVVFFSDYCMVSGMAQPVIQYYVAIGGVWKTVLARYVAIGGAWKV